METKTKDSRASLAVANPAVATAFASTRRASHRQQLLWDAGGGLGVEKAPSSPRSHIRRVRARVRVRIKVRVMASVRIRFVRVRVRVGVSAKLRVRVRARVRMWMRVRVWVSYPDAYP